MFTNFTRYRNQFGHEFTSARPLQEGWTVLKDEPAVDTNGKPLPSKVAPRNTAAKAKTPTPSSTDTSKGA